MLPLLATLALTGFFVLLIIAARNPFERLGHVNAWSPSIWTATIAFPILSFAGLIQALRYARAGLNPVMWWHSLITSLLLSSIAVFFGVFGLWAVHTWA